MSRKIIPDSHTSSTPMSWPFACVLTHARIEQINVNSEQLITLRSRLVARTRILLLLADTGENVLTQTVQPSRFRRDYPDFVWKSWIPGDQYEIGVGKIPISTRVVIFSSNSHKRKRNAEYLTLMSRKTEETARNIKQNQVLLCRKYKVAIKLPKIFGGNSCVRTPEMAFQSL